MNNEVSNWYYRYSLRGDRHTYDLAEDCPFTVLFFKHPGLSRWWVYGIGGIEAVFGAAAYAQAVTMTEMLQWCREQCPDRHQIIATDMTTGIKWFSDSYVFAENFRGVIFQDEETAALFKLTFYEFLGGNK